MKKFTPLFFLILFSCLPEYLPPLCEILLPGAGAEYKRGEVVQVNIKASDEDGNIEEVRLSLDGIGIASASSFPYNFTISTVGMSVGIHNLKAEAIDNHGQQTDATTTFNLKSGVPLVTTAPATSIASDSAVVGGVITDNGGGTVTAAGILWGTESYNGSNFHEVAAQVVDDAFSVTLKDLAFGTTYYVFAFAENESGRSLGAEISFNTVLPENIGPECEISVPQEGAEYTRGDVIQINVEATDEDGAISQVILYIDELGISTRNSFPYNFTYSTQGMEVGSHSIRVEAIDNRGGSSDASVGIVVKPELPELETSQPGSITSSSAVVGGVVTDGGGGTITGAGILWGSEPYNGTNFSELAGIPNNNAFAVTLTNLEYGTYYVIAYAENESGRSYGEQESFTTLLPYDLFIDDRDGHIYKWVQIGAQIWMAENLAYLPAIGSPYNYSATDPFYYVYNYFGFKVNEAKATANYDAYGVLYNYPASLEACPDGWHLPSFEEEQELITFIGGAGQINKLIETGTSHWNNNTTGTNTTGFSARGGGWVDLDLNGDISFSNLRDGTGWWKMDTCTIDMTTGAPFNIEMYSNPIFYDQNCQPFPEAYSVRCIKD